MSVEKKQLDAGQDILARRKAEQDANVFFPAFSRVVLEDPDGRHEVLWLVERFAGPLRIDRDWGGTARGGVVETAALDEGETVSKNGKLGLFLDQHGEQLGQDVPLPGGTQGGWGAATARIAGFAHYIPHRDDAIDGRMSVEVGSQLNFPSLKTLVGKLEELIGDPDTELIEAEIEEIRAQLQHRKKRIREFREAARTRIRHIITDSALRNQPKLDSEQLRVKQLQILDGQVVIHGGPGTGKTTALLDRINLLTDTETIREHVPGLSDVALHRLEDPHTAYRLFTPNELLAHYLSEAMSAKGLLTGSERLTTWVAYRDRLANEMGLLMADAEKSPFVKDRRAFRYNTRTFDVPGGEWGAFVSALRETFIEFVSRRHRRILRIDADASHDPGLVRAVQDRLAKAASARGAAELMEIFRSLHAHTHERVAVVHREGIEGLNDLATRLHGSVRADSEVHGRLIADLAALKKDDDDGGALEAAGEESLGADEGDETDHEGLESVNRLARSLLRKLALRRGLARVRLTKRERIMREHVGEWIDDPAVEALAPKLLTGMLRPYCAGPEANVVSQVRSFYPWLRRTHFAGRLSAFLHADVRDRVAESGPPKGKRIGPDELDLVLFLQLWLLRLRPATPAGFRSDRSRLSVAFQDSLREVVAVDEATDFSPVQLACMAMTTNPEYDCVTLCGDLMQRMTEVGLRGWDEYQAVATEVGLAPVHEADLRVSYRQSERLLAVTTKLYETNTGKVAPITSPYPPSDHDPPPLLHVGADLPSCADWLARRVVEIRRSYDNHRGIPTIAVLVPDEPSVNEVADALEDAPPLGGNVDVDRCHDGRVLGEGASVRIFNVEHIKGLEFEAALFHDMGAIACRFPRLADKLLYVGLSRASLYLGITVVGDVPQVLNPLLDDLVDSDWSA